MLEIVPSSSRFFSSEKFTSFFNFASAYATCSRRRRERSTSSAFISATYTTNRSISALMRSISLRISDFFRERSSCSRYNFSLFSWNSCRVRASSVSTVTRFSCSSASAFYASSSSKLSSNIRFSSGTSSRSRAVVSSRTARTSSRTLLISTLAQLRVSSSDCALYFRANWLSASSSTAPVASTSPV